MGHNLKNKKIVCFGDSITWYDGHTYTWGKEAGKIAVGYESYLREAGAIVQNEGISNATILDIYRHVLKTSFDTCDYILLSSGANDSRYNIPTGKIMPIGSIYDTNTFAGCLQSCIEHFHRNAPKTSVILMTPLKGWIYAPGGYEYHRNLDGEVEERFAEVIIRAGSFYNCSVCNWFYDIDLSEQNRLEMINDPEPDLSKAINPNPLYSLHPSTKGYRIMSEMLLKTIANT